MRDGRNGECSKKGGNPGEMRDTLFQGVRRKGITFLQGCTGFSCLSVW